MPGLISGALGGAGEAMMKVGLEQQRSFNDQELERLRSENTANREMALAKFREGVDIRAEDRGIANRAKERVLITEETLANKPLLTQAEIEADTAKKTADLDFYGKNKDALLGKKREEAAAGRNPTEDRINSLKAQAAQIELDYKKQEAKLPPAVKTRAEALRDEIKTINASISKAQADGMFDATSDNAKSLMERYSSLTERLDKMLSPYYGDKAPKDEPKDAAKQDVRVGGVVIGQAATAEEAKAMAQEFIRTRKPGAKQATEQSAPVDSLKGAIIGPMTPMSMIEESARAGNQKAIDYLNRRTTGLINSDLAPRTAADMLNQ